MLSTGLWKVVDGKLVNKKEGKQWNHFSVVKRGNTFSIQADGDSNIVLEDLELGQKNKGGWSSIKNLKSGEYLTATSHLDLEFRGMVSCFID